MTVDSKAQVDDLIAVFERAASTGVPERFTVDLKPYQDMIDDSDLTAEQKAELVEALWAFFMVYIDLGYCIHPLQEVCGQFHVSEEFRDNQGSGMIEYSPRESELCEDV